jgi:hypothetical protein
MFVTYGAIEKTLSNDEEQEYKELLQETEKKLYINKPTINKGKILSVLSMILVFVGVSVLIANNSGSSTTIPATNMIYNSSELFEDLNLSYPTINTISIPDLQSLSPTIDDFDLQSTSPTIIDFPDVELQSLSPTIVDVESQSASPTIDDFPDVELQSLSPTIDNTYLQSTSPTIIEYPDVELQSLSPTIDDTDLQSTSPTISYYPDVELQSSPPTIDFEYN